MRAIILMCIAAGCTGDAGDPGAAGSQGAQGSAGAQGANGEQGAKGAPEDNVQYVDADGNAIARFAMVSLSVFPVAPSVGGVPVVFDADQNMWQVSFDATTNAASAGPVQAPTLISYTGADCTGDAYLMIPGTAARNVPFKMPGDSMIRRLPKTNPVSVDVQSSTNGTTCSNFAITLTGFHLADTMPATPLVPPTLSWKGPIKAKWVE